MPISEVVLFFATTSTYDVDHKEINGSPYENLGTDSLSISDYSFVKVQR